MFCYAVSFQFLFRFRKWFLKLLWESVLQAWQPQNPNHSQLWIISLSLTQSIKCIFLYFTRYSYVVRPASQTGSHVETRRTIRGPSWPSNCVPVEIYPLLCPVQPPNCRLSSAYNDARKEVNKSIRAINLSNRVPQNMCFKLLLGNGCWKWPAKPAASGVEI